jgi:purine-cytosine permease-like protein
VGWVALIVLLVDETDEGFANLYSAAVSVQNIFPWLGQRALALGLGALVLVLAEVIPLTQYEPFLLLIGSLFVPLVGVLAADYFALRGGRYLPDGFFDRHGPYWYTGGVNWVGIACWAAGIATYLLIGGLGPLGFAGLAPWLGATLPSLALSFLLYLALGRLTVAGEVQRERRAAV